MCPAWTSPPWTLAHGILTGAYEEDRGITFTLQMRETEALLISQNKWVEPEVISGLPDLKTLWFAHCLLPVAGRAL